MATEVTTFNSDESSTSTERRTHIPAWIKVGAIASVSILAGGLAASWFYRKTVTRLQNAKDEARNSNFRIPEEE